MNTTKHKLSRTAALIHDGQHWRLFAKRAGSAAPEETIAVSAPATRIPEALLEKAVDDGIRRAAVLFSAPLHRADALDASSLPLAKAREAMAAAVAESAGLDEDDFLFAGATQTWPGVRKTFSLVAALPKAAMEECHAALEEAGIETISFSSLEYAIFAAWRKRVSAKTPFAAFWESGALAIPAPRGLNAGPQYIQCGLRHFDANKESSIARFRRAIGEDAEKKELHILSFGQNISPLLQSAGFENTVEENPGDWFGMASAQALAAKPEKHKAGVLPAVNPYASGKRFSNAWIAAAAAAVLLAPAATLLAMERQTAARLKSLATEGAKYAPLERRIAQAESELAAAKREYNLAASSMSARLAERRALVAFVNVAHFFCKTAGNTVLLDSIVQQDDKIAVRGTYSDPEDGVRLGREIIAFAKEKNIAIVENSTKRAEDSAFKNEFAIILDCSKVGRVAK